MQTIAHRLYADRFQVLYDTVVAVGSDNPAQARRQIEELLESAPNILEHPADIQALFFTEALRKRLDPEVEELGNLYLLPDAGRQIQMFNLMAEKFPVVHFSQEIINRLCQDEIVGESTVTIMDIGIGTGQQMVRLLEKTLPEAKMLKRLDIIGIEPAADSLKQAEASLLALAKSYPVEIRFFGIQKSAEDLSEVDWQTLDSWLSNRAGKLLVNGSFALHHIRPASLRTALFTRLKQYKPALLTLIEPYADFLTVDVAARFTHAWHHYGLVFQAIDQIDAMLEDKNAIKSMFFRREIQDVLSDDAHRVEQFETGEMWINRLQETGFQVQPAAAEETRIPNCPTVAITRHEQYLTLDVNGYPILSLIAAR